MCFCMFVCVRVFVSLFCHSSYHIMYTHNRQERLQEYLRQHYDGELPVVCVTVAAWDPYDWSDNIFHQL